MNRSQFFLQHWYQQQWQAFKSFWGGGGGWRGWGGGLLSNLLRFTLREGIKRRGEKMLKREKTETSNQQTKAAQTVGVHPSSRAARLPPK